MKTLLVANRGEIAVRILHAAAELGIRTVAVHSEDDVGALHSRRADAAHALRGVGVPAYLDIEQLLEVAAAHQCDAIHPGYGFLSESAEFARRCEERGFIFVGPTPEALETLGDKVRARDLARRCGVPVQPASEGPASLAEAKEFFASQDEGGAMMLKAVSGGGGLGMRAVRRAVEIDEAYDRCRSEALRAFGNGEVYAELLMPRARHIEVQVVGDGSGAVVHLGERECSIQWRHQKLVEVAPCPSLSAALRARLTTDAVRMAEAVRYRNAGTFEFLVDTDAMREDARYAFIEANPRLQVEHTVTEQVMGIDLVRLQLELAAGRSLAELGLSGADVRRPLGFAVQVRIRAETLTHEGVARASSGRLTSFELPSGYGVRTDTCGYLGYESNPHFDSLLVKLIGHSASPHFADAVHRTARALGEIEINGLATNVPLLERLLTHPEFVANRIDTRFLEDHITEIAPRDEVGRAARATSEDPLAVLVYGKTGQGPPPLPDGVADDLSGCVLEEALDEGCLAIVAPMQGTVVSVDVNVGDVVHAGQSVAVLNSMKMEHVVQAPTSGTVRRVVVSEGVTVGEGQLLVIVEEGELPPCEAEAQAESDPAAIRRDLEEARRRHDVTRDEARPEAVARRTKTGQRTARENIDDLCDAGSFVEYGALAIAAQRQRRSVEDLIERTPADGLVAGIGSINGQRFDEKRSQCAVLAYDYTVLAGTQGFLNHRKKDRMLMLAERLRLPVVFFTEGGGGRPGDTDAPGVAGLDCMAFHLFGRLSGLVPLVGINSGRCFAGNAALLGCCDVVIATANSTIGMGGPAMIEGGGLGVFRPEEVGPMNVQVPNGVVDIAVADEAEAVRVAKQYLSYFQGRVDDWECADQLRLRNLIPENRLRVYEVRSVIETLADKGSVLELRRQFGRGMVTALARFEGRPVGVIANDPKHLAGAIDSNGADKAARFMQLCDAFEIPILFLCDTPGIMVGPEVEKSALVRHCSRLFVIGASLTVPYATIVIRKSYGLGAQAMAGGSHKAPLFTVSWPTGEFGGMGLEGAVKLGFRKELAAIEDPTERQERFARIVERAYEHGKALNTATHFEIDDVIDPAESRRWIMTALRSVPDPPPRNGKKRPCVDTW